MDKHLGSTSHGNQSSKSTGSARAGSYRSQCTMNQTFVPGASSSGKEGSSVSKSHSAGDDPKGQCNNGPNGHLFYVGGDLMMRRGMLPIIIPPASTKLKGGILVSPCPSVRLSVCGQNHVRSVSSTILIGSI